MATVSPVFMAVPYEMTLLLEFIRVFLDKLSIQSKII
jgi:hypothetical protein